MWEKKGMTIVVSETNEGENEEKGRKLCKKVTMQTSVDSDCVSGGEGMLFKKAGQRLGNKRLKVNVYAKTRLKVSQDFIWQKKEKTEGRGLKRNPNSYLMKIKEGQEERAGHLLLSI